MAEQPWSLQDAKNSFSAVVEAAVQGRPQMVTRHGKPAVVVVSAPEYERLRRREKAGVASFVDHLLGMPQDGQGDERAAVAPRDVDF